MSFEQKLRERITAAPFRSREKDILKVVLGEAQQKGKFTDEQGCNIVKSMLKNNTETLGLLAAGDSRRAQYEEENRVLQTLLPAYLSPSEIRAKLDEAGLAEQIRAAKNEGQATGVAMKHLKGLQLPVEGDAVKQVILALRS